MAEIIRDKTLSGVFGWPDALVGAVFLLLGFFVRRQDSTALGIAVALLGGILALRIIGALAAFSQGAVPTGLGGIAIGIGVLVLVSRGFGAIRELEAEEGEKLGSPTARSEMSSEVNGTGEAGSEAVVFTPGTECPACGAPLTLNAKCCPSCDLALEPPAAALTASDGAIEPETVGDAAPVEPPAGPH